MILSSDLAPKFKAVCPTFGQECASVLFQRGLIAEKDQDRVAEVIGQFAGAAEPAAAELSQQRLITQQNKAAVSEFIKRVVKRLLLKTNGLSGDELGRILGIDRALAFRILKGTRSLTADHIKTLVTRLIVSADAPSV
jgi:hypothetical protein